MVQAASSTRYGWASWFGSAAIRWTREWGFAAPRSLLAVWPHAAAPCRRVVRIAGKGGGLDGWHAVLVVDRHASEQVGLAPGGAAFCGRLALFSVPYSFGGGRSYRLPSGWGAGLLRGRRW